MQMRRRQRGEKGSAAVEFALILPIFLLLLFGIIDFGYMINRSSMINNAARDAVREASLGGTYDQVKGVAEATLVGVPDATVDVRCEKSGGAVCNFRAAHGHATERVSGDRAVVTIEYQHKMLTPVGMFVPGGFDLTRRAEMRIE